MSIDKQFHGDLQDQQGRDAELRHRPEGLVRGYVALEQVTGTAERPQRQLRPATQRDDDRGVPSSPSRWCPTPAPDSSRDSPGA